MNLKSKIITFFNRLILPSAEKLMEDYSRDKLKIQKSIVNGLTSKNDDLKDIVINTTKYIDAAHIYINQYDNLIKELKTEAYDFSSNKEDGVRKNLMLTFYSVKDKHDITWFLVVDMTNSPYISLRDYWELE